MATLQSRLSDLVTAIGTDIKALLATRGNLASLTTDEKTNLVGAINELQAEINAVTAGAVINDAAPSNSTTAAYSANKITTLISAAISALVNGAGSSLDTLKELADELTAQGGAAAALTTAVANRVRFDAAQSLDAAQKAQAKSNIDALGTTELGNPDTNLVTIYTAAKA